MDELIGKLWARRHELTDDEWREASPILLGYAVAMLAERKKLLIVQRAAQTALDFLRLCRRKSGKGPTAAEAELILALREIQDDSMA